MTRSNTTDHDPVKEGLYVTHNGIAHSLWQIHTSVKATVGYCLFCLLGFKFCRCRLILTHAYTSVFHVAITRFVLNCFWKIRMCWGFCDQSLGIDLAHFCNIIPIKWKSLAHPELIHFRRKGSRHAQAYCLLVSYQIRKITDCACTGDAGNLFPAINVKGNR